MSELTWGELVQGYLDQLRGTGRSPATLETMERAVRRWVEFCRARDLHRPAQVCAAHVARYQTHLERASSRLGDRLSDSTVKLCLRAARSLFRWALAHERLLVDPTADLVVGKARTRCRGFLTVTEVESLLALPHPSTPIGLRDRAFLETLYSAGLRNQEACSLDLHDLELEPRTLFVARGKGGRDRVLPVGEVLAEALEAYLLRGRPQLVGGGPDPGALFVTRFGTRLSREMARILMRRYVARAGLARPWPTPHTLRHSAATHLLEGGADLLQIQAFLGHASVQSTQRYAHLFPLELLNEHRRTHPRAIAQPREAGLGNESGIPRRC